MLFNIICVAICIAVICFWGFLDLRVLKKHMEFVTTNFMLKHKANVMSQKLALVTFGFTWLMADLHKPNDYTSAVRRFRSYASNSADILTMFSHEEVEEFCDSLYEAGELLDEIRKHNYEPNSLGEED